jgi:hypothetical protein
LKIEEGTYVLPGNASTVLQTAKARRIRDLKSIMKLLERVGDETRRKSEERKVDDDFWEKRETEVG